MTKNPEASPAFSETRLSRRTKLFYGVGDTGFSLTSTLLGAYFAIFLTDVVGIAPSIAAAAIFIGRSWDYINDPLIGHISDRTRTRWGRRRPFLLFGAIPYALVFMLLWWRPPWTNDVALAVYYAVAYVLFDAAATFVYMPYFALTPELTLDYDERTALTSYRMFFSILGSLISFTLPLAIVGSFTPQNAPRVMTMGVIFGVTAALAVLITFFGTREREVFMAQAQPSLRQSLRAAKSNKAFLFGLGIFLCTWVVVSIVQASLLYFIKYVMQREAQSDLIMGLIFITAIVALPFWEWAARRKSKQWAYIVGIAFWAIMQLVLITVNANTGLPAIYLLCVMAGIGVSAAHVLPWSLIPDAVEWGEWQTGERHEGMFYSLITLAEKIASSIAVPLALLLLDVTGYVPNATQQPASALWGIRLTMGPIPAVLLGLGIFLAFKYPLTRARYAQLVQDLEERRKQRIMIHDSQITCHGVHTMNIRIRPVQTAREQRTFLTFPWRIYRDDPLWVPPLLPERAKAIVKRQGPFFERGFVEFFIAWRDGRPVGTICLAEDTPTNAERGTRECIFGFFECIEEYAVAEALFDFAGEWAKQRNLDALFGPFNLDYEDGYGILVEGRDRPPALLCGHTPPYYQTFVERYGFVPARASNLAYAFDLEVDHPTLQRLARLADKVRQRGEITVRGADLAQWDAEVDRVHELLNVSLGHLEDAIPWARESVAALVAPFTQIADPDLVLFAEVKGDNAGWFAGIPNLNEALIHANGLRYPWNYAQAWLAMRRRPKCLAVKSLLVKPQYWKTGVSVLLFDEMAKRAQAKGYTWIDLSLTSADNPDTPVLAERMGSKLYKRYQVYRVKVD